MKSAIHFVSTGGTIDSYYDGTKDTVVPNKTSVIRGFVKEMKLNLPQKFTTVCMKDSRDLTKSDRKRLLKVVKESPCSRIVITHGTYTMPETARYLEANLPQLVLSEKTIILTGSFIPLVGITPSDAAFNLGYAIARVQELPPGMYVCMNGRVFTPKEVVKLVPQGRFASVFAEK